LKKRTELVKVNEMVDLSPVLFKHLIIDTIFSLRIFIIINIFIT